MRSPYFFIKNAANALSNEIDLCTSDGGKHNKPSGTPVSNNYLRIGKHVIPRWAWSTTQCTPVAQFRAISLAHFSLSHTPIFCTMVDTVTLPSSELVPASSVFQAADDRLRVLLSGRSPAVRGPRLSVCQLWNIFGSMNIDVLGMNHRRISHGDWASSPRHGRQIHASVVEEALRRVALTSKTIQLQ